MLDAGRIQPTTDESRRSTTPRWMRVGLTVALGVNPAAVTFAPGPPQGQQLAAVQSAPLGVLRQMMNLSDNVMAESMAREVARATGGPWFRGRCDAVTSQLASAGVDMTGASLQDSSSVGG